MEEIGWDEKDYEGSIYCIGYVKQWYRSRILDLNKKAKLWQIAPNPPVSKIDGRKLYNLLDFQKKGRPLILNFGSCTWPPFVAKLSEFKKLVDEFCDKADFLIIYIEEAHASDGWKFRNNYDINIHRTLEDRLQAARELEKLNPGCPIVVDTMSDIANESYGALYERLYIVLDEVIVYEGKRGPVGYKIDEVKAWLDKYVKS